MDLNLTSCGFDSRALRVEDSLKHIDKHPRCRYAEEEGWVAWRKHVRDFFIWLVVGTAALYGVSACVASAFR